jgi:hypothetical protein
MVDTAQVLMLAPQSSETASPFQVDGGYVFTDTTETGEPITAGAGTQQQ